jgi:Zinc knuckle
VEMAFRSVEPVVRGDFSPTNQGIERIEALLTQQIQSQKQLQQRQQPPRVTCNICYKEGHTAAQCRSTSINQERKRQGICFNCNKPGHIARQCTSPRVKITCTHCKRDGHTVDKCWTKYGKPKDSQRFEGDGRIGNNRLRPTKSYYVNQDDDDEEEVISNKQLAREVSQLAKKLKSLKV